MAAEPSGMRIVRCIARIPVKLYELILQQPIEDIGSGFARLARSLTPSGYRSLPSHSMRAQRLQSIESLVLLDTEDSVFRLFRALRHEDGDGVLSLIDQMGEWFRIFANAVKRQRSILHSLLCCICMCVRGKCVI